MENIEQLKQENEKLNARLAKAVEVFKEQKTNIENLTNEVKEKTELALDYRNQIQTLTNKVSELENSYENLGAEYQAAINCNERNNKELIDTDEKIEELNKQLNEYELKLQAAEEKAEMWQKNLRAVENTTNEEVKKVTAARDELISKCKKLENDIESKDKAYEVLQNTYNEVWAENKQLKEQVNSCEFNAESNANNLADLQKQLNEYELKLQNADAAYEELRKKYEARKEQIVNLENQIEQNNVEILARQDSESAYIELNMKYETQVKEISDLQMKVTQLEKDNEIALKSSKEYKQAYAEVKSQLTETENTCINKDKEIESKNLFIEQLQKTYDNVFAELNEIKETNTKNINAYNDLKNNFDILTNDKLELEADFAALQEEYDRLRILSEKDNIYKEFVYKMFALAESINITYKTPEVKQDQNQSKVGDTHNQFMSDAPELTM